MGVFAANVAVVEGGECHHAIVIVQARADRTSVIVATFSCLAKSDVLIVAELVYRPGLEKVLRILMNAGRRCIARASRQGWAHVDLACLDALHLSVVIARSGIVLLNAQRLPELVLEGRCRQLQDALPFLLHNKRIDVVVWETLNSRIGGFLAQGEASVAPDAIVGAKELLLGIAD